MLIKRTIIQPGLPAQVSEHEVETAVHPDTGATVPAWPQVRALILPVLVASRPGAHLEHVTVLWNGKHADMFVDDESLVHGLPRNEEATAIYRAAALKRSPALDPERLSYIAGPAILFDNLVWY